MRVVVPDASVILKWVLPDPEGERDMESALEVREAAVRGEITVKVPSLWIYEVGNTLTRRFPGHAQEAMDALTAFGMDEAGSSGAWLEQAVTLTRRHGVTFYDAAYHALALVEEGVFVTADTRYVRKAGRAGAVMTVAEWAAA